MKTKIVPLPRRGTYPNENAKMPLDKCREILCRNGRQFTDEQVIAIRDFMYKLADIFLEHSKFLEPGQGKVVSLADHKPLPNDEGNYLRAS